jgi:hypothetical protein
MNKLEVIEQIVNIMTAAPKYDTVVIGGHDDMTMLEAIRFFCQTSIDRQDWKFDVNNICKNAILIF